MSILPFYPNMPKAVCPWNLTRSDHLLDLRLGTIAPKNPTILIKELLLSAKHRSTMPNLFITSGWAYVFHMTSPLILVLYHSEVLQKPVQA